MPAFHNGLSDDFKVSVKKLQAWFETPAGVSLLDAQQQRLDKVLETTFGYYACQLSVVNPPDLLKHCAVGHHFSMMLSERPEQNAPSCSTTMGFDPYYWPVNPGCLDVVVLHHMLDVAQNPHRLLSEAAKSIMPEGKLIIIGFNSWSLHGLSRWVMPKRFRAFSSSRFLPISRLRDWLTLLGFTIERVDYGAYCHPFMRGKKEGMTTALEQRLSAMQCPLGSFYMIQATHEVHGVTPLRASWKHVKRSLAGAPTARPSPSARDFGERH